MKAKLITFVRGLKNGTPPRFLSYLKSLTLILTLLLSVNVWGAIKEFTPTNFNGQGRDGGSSISYTNSPITVSSSKGYGYSTGQTRIFSGGTLVVSCSSGYAITKVDLSFTSASYQGGLSTSYPELSTTSWTSPTLTGTARISKITVTYTAAAPATPYTVLFNAGSGTCTSSLTEAPAGAGVTLPTPTISCGDWVFAGWKETSAQTETTTKPTLLAAGSNYKPSSNNCTLYAVYSKTESSGGGTSNVTFTHNNSGGWTTESSVAQTGTIDGVTISTTAGTHNENNSDLRVNKNATFTVSSSSTISSIVFTSSNYDWSKVDKGSYSNKTWTGSANSITFTAGSGQVRMTEIVVTVAGSSTTTYNSTPDCGPSTYTLLFSELIFAHFYRIF